MPYIKNEVKKKFEYDNCLGKVESLIESKGDLNYVICELVGGLILRDGISYTSMSEKIDAVHDAELELRRRLLDLYENRKIIENGDVPTFKAIIQLMEEHDEGCE